MVSLACSAVVDAHIDSYDVFSFRARDKGAGRSIDPFPTIALVWTCDPQTL
jgi:hypothetical protein